MRINLYQFGNCGVWSTILFAQNSINPIRAFPVLLFETNRISKIRNKQNNENQRSIEFLFYCGKIDDRWCKLFEKQKTIGYDANNKKNAIKQKNKTHTKKKEKKFVNYLCVRCIQLAIVLVSCMLHVALWVCGASAKLAGGACFIRTVFFSSVVSFRRIECIKCIKYEQQQQTDIWI